MHLWNKLLKLLGQKICAFQFSDIITMFSIKNTEIQTVKYKCHQPPGCGISTHHFCHLPVFLQFVTVYRHSFYLRALCAMNLSFDFTYSTIFGVLPYKVLI